MLIKLGKELRKAREAKGVSLESVADPAKISAAYLHKLERGVVDSPSPRVLARLAAVLEVSYLRLMERAGYFDERQLAEARMRKPSLQPHPLADQQLNSKEWRAVGDFIKKLIAQRKTDGLESDPSS
jgi:transcriptional regulator with XRE-family HTH domain